jgi:hypothetical protein
MTDTENNILETDIDEDHIYSVPVPPVLTDITDELETLNLRFPQTPTASSTEEK